jgi:hypothetical protein
MNFAEEIRIIIDSLTYVQVYGPDKFPEEDGTELSSEARRIIERFDVVAPAGRGSTRQHWLRLARQEIVDGFEAFPTNAEGGRRKIEEGIEFIRKAIRGAAPQTAFIVGPDGVTHHARDMIPRPATTNPALHRRATGYALSSSGKSSRPWLSVSFIR